ncbi:uncharacterized protein BCR38DRAFT_354291 [Pseudomassariella vexata]|uniref:F-box domain-containing protein n=1 Tax=Pseudomassariella vexata TaxID=1141098 RepID=A0A1Y2DEJ1_9PEZI|nr:uncharacterized protein BCR38DRAFT_354291 [Pseudomassariella vexata]ORY57514.1 hypothetical protein BCR38DRAFT_354291 [Pseudomassariella vexata]
MHSPASSQSSFELWNSGPRRVEHGWHRPAPIKQYRKKAAPGEIFAALPGEVLEIILDELRNLHLAPSSTSCATCMMRDLCAAALAARKLLKFARVALYEDIQLVGNDSHIQKKRYKINYGSRMVLLRRTLRANPQIAAIVHNVKVPAPPPQGLPLGEYQNLIASVIMACPNFERLMGPLQNYDHNPNRLFHALSTREKLKEMNWLVQSSPFQRQRRLGSNSTMNMLNQYGSVSAPPPGDLQPHQSTAFLDMHVNWTHLTTLMIHCLPGATLTPTSLIVTALGCLPALQNLYLSHLPHTSFNDSNLLSLPPLKSLSLSHLPGVTSAGLSSFATRYSSRSIRNLAVKHSNLNSLPAMARILSNLVSLETFTFVQSTAPILPEHEMIWLFPYLASPSLRKIHWDVTNQAACANVADGILAKSIAAHGFPSLRTLRTPNDPEGMFQTLCRPTERIEMASDRFRGRSLIGNNSSRPDSPDTMTTRSEVSAGEKQIGQEDFKESNNLHPARRAAQSRLDAARRFPRFFVNVIDEDGTLLEKFGLAGFLGQLDSQVEYCLTPDDGAIDENGGLVEISDLLGDGGEDLNEREGCTGRWNTYGNVVDKKDRDRLMHTERGRWRPVTLI